MKPDAPAALEARRSGDSSLVTEDDDIEILDAVDGLRANESSR